MGRLVRDHASGPLSPRERVRVRADYESLHRIKESLLTLPSPQPSPGGRGGKRSPTASEVYYFRKDRRATLSHTATISPHLHPLIRRAVHFVAGLDVESV